MTETKDQVATPQVPTQAVAPVKSDHPVKLTTEEENQRYQFIGRCVDNGVMFPSNTKFGVMGGMSIQDICNSATDTLAKIAIKIKKEDAEHDPEFSNNEELKIAKIPATKWLEFLRLTIRKKNWIAYASDMRAQKKGLQAQIAAAKTPDELRKEAEAKLAALGTEFPDEE